MAMTLPEGVCVSMLGLTLNPMAGRPGLPGNAKESAAAAKLAANSGLWTLGFDIVTGIEKQSIQTLTTQRTSQRD